MKYWVHVISKDHALTGVEAGFMGLSGFPNAIFGPFGVFRE